MKNTNFPTINQSIKSQFEESLEPSIGAESKRVPVTAPPPVQDFKLSSADEWWINNKYFNMTSKQRRVFQWIYGEITRRDQTFIISFYGKISRDLGITKRAVRSIVSALIKKETLYDFGIVYRSTHSRQAIGKCFFIPNEISLIHEKQLSIIQKWCLRELC